MSVYSTSERRLIVVGPPYSRVPPADRAASLALLMLLLPMIVLIAAALWLAGGGPIFAATPCLDAHGRRCRLWSFRTRRSRLLGRLLREHGLDRLPVLWSVAHGTVTLREALALEPIG
jgi:lipopolysaccharide/colanic/teichoic acid biosynthesis glycosyltransferase